MTFHRLAGIIGAGICTVGVAFVAGAAGAGDKTAESAVVAYQISEGPSFKAINASLTGKPGDAKRGENVIAGRKKGNCFACHTIAKLAVKARNNPKKYADQGKIGPRLDGVADNYTEGELRMLVTDPKQINPGTMMPSFYRTEGLHRVMGKFKGKAILSAQDVEDVVAFLMTLKSAKPVAVATAASAEDDKDLPKLVEYTISQGPSIKAINASLTGKPGDPKNGEKVIVQRKKGNCFACHTIGALNHKAVSNPKSYADQGKIGPRLDGVGSRLTEGELRMLVTDPKQVRPGTFMPGFYRNRGLHRVMGKFKGKTILSAQEVEDVVAFLSNLTSPTGTGMGGMRVLRGMSDMKK